ncbi:MAG: segregation/condensation protein A [Deferribacteraceae bacterium]|jgi:segregation and condensation protein A|nr:segregation/condensation protein A [Deferribacteraceae bacterium]
MVIFSEIHCYNSYCYYTCDGAIYGKGAELKNWRSVILEITIDNYEGPLDLLIHLVHKNEMDIFDVPISEITTHFIAEIRRMQALDVEVAAEFINMASYLIYLKSRSLLPSEGANDEEFVAETFNLAQLLVMLSYCKDLAQALRNYASSAAKSLCRRQGILLPKGEPERGDLFRLSNLFFEVTAEKPEEKVIVRSLKEQADAVATRMTELVLSKDETLWSELTDIFTEPFDKAIAFSSMLVLSKNQIIRSIQESNFSDILMKRLRNVEP